MSALACFCALVISADGQQNPATPQPVQDDEVVRVSTELVQTDVMVFDKGGRPVAGLRPEQFELSIDGRPQEVSFFEYVTADGSGKNNASQAARGGVTVAGGEKLSGRRPPPGRTIIFYLDDVHLSPESINRARRLLNVFIDRDMRQGDQVLIASASGQLGFLQQPIEDREVLHAVVGRLNYRGFALSDNGDPAMNMTQALTIERGEAAVLAYFVEQIMSENPSVRRQLAEVMVKQRAGQMIREANIFERNLLGALESFVRSLAQLPGRKIAYFVSDGFVMDHKGGDGRDRMWRITDAAARSGVTVYTLDARGLLSGAVEASSKIRPSLSGASAGVIFNSSDDVSASQEALYVLAENTGGRALLNTNGLEDAVSTSLRETDQYYLLVWRPDAVARESASGGGRPKFREIKVAIKGRPDLVVLVNRGFFDAPPELPRLRTPANLPASDPTTDRLRAAITAPAPRGELPLSLHVAYTSDAGGNALSAAVQIPIPADAAGGTGRDKTVDVAAVVFDSEGKSVPAQVRQLKLSSSAKAAEGAGALVTKFLFKVKPGLYQVRVAARDGQSGRTGVVHRWIKISSLEPDQLALSSIVLFERRMRESPPAGEAPFREAVQNVDGRFKRTSVLQFEMYVYNAVRAGGATPDVTTQIDIISDGRALLSAPAQPLPTAGSKDLTRIRYAADIPLGQIPTGAYTLKLNVEDRLARKSQTRQVDFVIE